jgi:hypothetical protein
MLFNLPHADGPTIGLARVPRCGPSSGLAVVVRSSPSKLPWPWAKPCPCCATVYGRRRGVNAGEPLTGASAQVTVRPHVPVR